MEILKELTQRLERLMYGHNYQVTLGVRDLGRCASLDDVRQRIKLEFPGAEPFSAALTVASAGEFWQDIEDAFTYRGDAVAGLKLTPSDELRLSELQETFRNSLVERSPVTARFFNYPDETGIPGYPVYWDLRYVIFQENFNCLFVFGAASD